MARTTDLDALDISMTVLFPVYGLVMGLILMTDHDYRRDGLLLLAGGAAVTVLLALLLLLMSL